MTKEPRDVQWEDYAERDYEMERYIEQEKGWPLGPPTSMRFSVTGEEYHEFGFYGPTREAVLSGMKAAFDEYAKGKTGKLYWRVRPELEPSRPHRIYMRLLISDKSSTETRPRLA